MRINGTVWSARDIAARIDHTVLAPDATRKDMENACVLARAYGFEAVFTNPYWTPLVAELLDGSGIAAGISAAFPLGSLSTDAKVAEVMDAVARVDGKPCAVDMVTNIALLKEGHFDDYTRDIAAVVNAVEGRGIIVAEAILETSLLNAEEVRTACRCAAEAGVDFVKTSTGRAGAPALSHISGSCARRSPPTLASSSPASERSMLPELALWAFFLGADVLGSPCGDVIVDVLSSGYAEVGTVRPILDASSAEFGGNALLHAQAEMAKGRSASLFSCGMRCLFDRFSAKVGSLHLSEKDL